MDRTKAVELLNRALRCSKTGFEDCPTNCSMCENYATIEDGTEALTMAIEALKQPEIIRCRDCYWWTKQEASLQGRCALTGTYPTGAFFCGNARQRPYPCDPEKNQDCSQARRAIKELINDGMIFYTSQGRPAIESSGEYRELVCEAAPPINGYALTKSGFKSAEYKAAYEEWETSLEEWAET